MNRFKVDNESFIKHYLIALKSINRSQTFDQIENIKCYLDYIHNRFNDKDLTEVYNMVKIREENILKEFIIKN